MNPFANEEIMWQRLKDLQREAENSRLFAQNTVPVFVRLVGVLIARARGAVHGLGLAPRWWAVSAEPISDSDPKADTHAA
ncbi:MAG TPA: hypothetical protein VGX27_01920 [Candidatus Dormibacteraeota bacterium]|nr:hypothetical protein [Candidatus Dormibacteraeota bacterium]